MHRARSLARGLLPMHYKVLHFDAKGEANASL